MIEINGVKHYSLEEARRIVWAEEDAAWRRFYENQHTMEHVNGTISWISDSDKCMERGRTIDEQYELAGYTQDEDGRWTKSFD